LSGIQRDCTINGCQWLLVSWASLQQLADCGQQDRKPGYWIPSVAHLAITVPLVDHEVSVDAVQPGSSTDLALFPFDAMGMGTPSRVILNRPGVWMNTAGEERTIHPVSALGELGRDSLGDIASGAVFTRVPD
jgi:hypothetical protein